MIKILRLTNIDYAILGLLHQQSLSGYGIRKIFETTALGNYSSSPGTIYPAIKRLRSFQLVNKKRYSQNSSSQKKLFYITAKGKKELIAWLITPIEMEDILKGTDKLLLRFAFMDDLITLDKKVTFLKSFIDKISEYLKYLIEYHKNEYSNLKLHGRLALENGIEIFKAHLRWGRYTLNVLLRNQNKINLK